jgi:metal-dependent amidase/aminoacylase/carboxypeptidase family protein
VTDSPHDAIPRYQDELTEIRSDLHANPKLGLEEHRTSSEQLSWIPLPISGS